MPLNRPRKSQTPLNRRPKAITPLNRRRPARAPLNRRHQAQTPLNLFNSSLLLRRWGPDGKPFTQDDRVYNSMDEVRAALGMSPEQFQLVQDFLSLTSAVDRIESTGIIAGYEKRIFVIATRNTVPVIYLSWQEK